MVAGGGLLLFSLHRHLPVIAHNQRLVIPHLLTPVVHHFCLPVVLYRHRVIMTHRHLTVIPRRVALVMRDRDCPVVSGCVFFTHRDGLPESHSDALVIADGLRMVHLHISGSVVQHLRIHVLLRMDIDLLIARRIIEFQFVKSATFVGLRADGHLRFRARQAARRAVILVVGAAHNNGLVRVAVQEIHYHFLTHTRNGEVAESGTGPRL